MTECIAKWMAVAKKIYAVSFNEKVKLILKIMGRPFGLKRCLFLGGYDREEDKRQIKHDELVYQKLVGLEETMWYTPSYIEFTQKQEKVHIPKKKREILQHINRDSYIALVVENLDRGGLEEVVRLLALEFQSRQLNVRVLVLRQGGEIAEELLQSHIEVIYFEENYEFLKQYLKQNRPWIVNTHYIQNLEALKILNEFPVVETIHNMYVFQDDIGIEIEQKKTPMIDRFIAVSEAARTVYCRKVLMAEQKSITVIGNALSGERKLTRSRDEIRRQLEISEDTMVFLAAGSIDSRKNQLGLLRAWSVAIRLMEKPAILLIAGQGTDPEYETKVQRMVKERKLEDTVYFLGYRKDVYDLMNASDIMVVDSYYEGWSMAATESLSCGTPVIHSDCGSGRELTAGGQNGILIDNPLNNLETYDSVQLYDITHAGINENIEQLVCAILTTYRNRIIWAKRKSMISEYARATFQAESMAEQYLIVYLETVLS